MVIDRDLSKYIIFSEDSILNALQKISDNRIGLVFLISESGQVEGVFTDGDFRRWIFAHREINIQEKVICAANKDFVSASLEQGYEYIVGLFDLERNIKYIPLVDAQRHLVGVACWRGTEIRIGEHLVNEQSPAFIIAEIGNNHNGSLALAKELIKLAKEAGADCAKFQMRDLDELYLNRGEANDPREDLGSQYVLDLLSRFQLSRDELFAAFDFCKEVGIIPLCTPWDMKSFKALEGYGMEAYKVASADLTNHDLLLAIAQTHKPVICSTGMSQEQEIEQAVELLQKQGAQYILLHCNSTYPAPFKDINLRYLDRLRELGNCLVGYSGHERGIAVPVAAVALGAKVIEKHFTIDRNMEGNDHKVSLLPGEFAAMVEGIRQVEQSLGSKSKMISQGELINRESLAKSLVINCDLKKGELISEEMIVVKSPGKGLQPNRKKELIGLKARRDFKKGDFFYPSDIQGEEVRPRDYNFSRPWGVPVRYHDFRMIMACSNPDLLEFHLSYKDLEEDLDSFFQPGEKFALQLVVHSPELFAGDHILNLCAEEESYRRHSIAELNRVTELTRRLQHYFSQDRTPIVVNVGGFSRQQFVGADKRQEFYDRLEGSLKEIDTTDVELIPQTMPPFPWHFGGQSHHNIFVDPDEIRAFCDRIGLRICLDLSHSQLACNYYQWSMSDFIKKVGPVVAHLHVADAKGLDGEGLQIGEGNMDFALLGELLNRYAPTASFIPEIWQGHKDGGYGFWLALERLEGKL